MHGVDPDPGSMEPQRAFTCQIGDSRIYCYRHGELFQLTTDHTIGNDMIRQGRDIAKVPERMHVLTRVVGTNQVIFPTWQEVGVYENDIFLICLMAYNHAVQ